MCKTAVILAGGAGKRMEKYTNSLPKPLLPIQATPLLELILAQLARFGFKRVILATHYKSDLIRDYCKDGSKWGLCVEYTKETVPLGTIGPLKLIPELPENFLIMNGDILTDFSFGDFYDRHVEGKHLFTIGSYERSETFHYGVLETKNEWLVSFKEKPSITQTVNMGIYMANRRVLEYIPEQTFFGLNDLVAVLLQERQRIAVVSHSGKWIDIGTPSQYTQAQTADL